MAAVASIAAGIQFGWWPLQLSLLTPYVQLLGVPHQWAAKIWLYGPISRMVMQPLDGLFSFFMAIGNILGYLAGSYEKLHTLFPFMETRACNAFCADLKVCFFFSVLLLVILSTFTLLYEEDILVTALESESQVSCFASCLVHSMDCQNGCGCCGSITAINWVAWFPFFLFDTDWMGHEIYDGTPGDQRYIVGVHKGELGLTVNAAVLALISLVVESLGV